MTRLASGWNKIDKNGNVYTSWSFDKDLLPLTITADKCYTSKPNKNKTGENPKAPDCYFECFIPDPTKAKKKENLQDPNIQESMITDEEIPF